MTPDKTISDAIRALSDARSLFLQAKNEGLILGNDNHIGDIGEYWVMKLYQEKGLFKEYAPEKNSPYDLALTDGTKVSVKTITDWSDRGYGTQIKPLCGTQWSVLAAVYLKKNLMPHKIALVDITEINQREPFISNAKRRSKGTKTFPRFQWWQWLEDFIEYDTT